MNKIYTSRDAANAKMHAEYLAEVKALRKELTAKVRRWDAKAEKFGGEIHKATAAKFRAELAAL